MWAAMGRASQGSDRAASDRPASAHRAGVPVRGPGSGSRLVGATPARAATCAASAEPGSFVSARSAAEERRGGAQADPGDGPGERGEALEASPDMRLRRDELEQPRLERAAPGKASAGRGAAAARAAPSSPTAAARASRAARSTDGVPRRATAISAISAISAIRAVTAQGGRRRAARGRRDASSPRAVRGPRRRSCPSCLSCLPVLPACPACLSCLPVLPARPGERSDDLGDASGAMRAEHGELHAGLLPPPRHGATITARRSRRVASIPTGDGAPSRRTRGSRPPASWRARSRSPPGRTSTSSTALPRSMPRTLRAVGCSSVAASPRIRGIGGRPFVWSGREPRRGPAPLRRGPEGPRGPAARSPPGGAGHLSCGTTRRKRQRPA